MVAAAGALALLGRLDLFQEPLLPTFAIGGALHALTLVSSLTSPHPMSRKILFLVAAALLNVSILYVGILGLQVLSGIPSAGLLYVDLGVCAGVGALSYSLLIRYFWLPALRPRTIAKILLFCVAATAAALAARHMAGQFGIWWFIAVWWFAFSTGLGLFDGRRAGSNMLGRHSA